MVAVFFLFKLVDVTYLNEPCFVAEGYRGSFILKEFFTTSFPDSINVVVRLVETGFLFHKASGRALKLGRRPHRFEC
jgi:hypothetical protein